MIRLFQVFLWLLNLALGIFYIATLVQLLSKWVGPLAYVLWIVAAPVCSPAILFFPWFEAWVTGEGINQTVFLLWVTWISAQGLALLISLIQARRVH